MKTNEAPERLYLSKNIYSTFVYQTPDPDDETQVEYFNTDTFIEKSQSFFRQSHYLFCLDGMDLHNFIEDFKKYVKGE